MTAAVPHHLVVDLLGSVFELQTADANTFADVRRLWQPFLAPEGATGAAVVRLDQPSAPERLEHFATAVNASALDAAPYFAVHAGVVAHGGLAVAMPAVSGTGKSTMTAACLRRGFEYVSDEALCLRYGDGAVVPYPRPIGLSPWSAEAVGVAGNGTPAVGESLFTAEELGSARREAPARLRHIVVLDRTATSATPSPGLVAESRPSGVTLLLQQSFNHYRRGADAIRLAAEVIGEAEVWILRYADPVAAADLLWNSFVGEAAKS